MPNDPVSDLCCGLARKGEHQDIIQPEIRMFYSSLAPVADIQARGDKSFPFLHLQ